MKKYYKKDTKSAFQAKFDAQKIAFAPVVFQATKVMRHLGILELVEKKGNDGITADEISSQLDISLYGVKVLLDMGLSAELFWLNNEHFILTKTGHFIIADTMTRVNMDFINDVCYEGLFYLEDAIRTEKPAGLKVFGEWKTIYQALSQLPPKVQKSWFAFDHFYSDVAFSRALKEVFKTRPKRLFDVGGNTGKWALRCVEYDDDVHVTILDLPGQLDKAMFNAQKRGFEARIDGYPIDLLSKDAVFPTGTDAIWMSQFLDCFSEEEIVSILKRAQAAMSEDTILYILETYWDRQAFEAGAFSLNSTSLYFTAMANGNSRMYHSKDMIKLVHQANMYIDEDIDNIGLGHTLFKCKIKK